MATQTHQWGELSLEELYTATEATKYLALASCVFLICETITTLPEEVKYVWNSRWSFGRVMFHANRVWGLVMLLGYVPTAFAYNLSQRACMAAWLFYIYASIIAQIIVASVLVARIWAIYEMKPWVLVAVCLGCALIASPSIVILQLQASSSNLLENPAPTLISGCPTKLNALAFLPYLPPFLSETLLFVMTAYKPWKMSRSRRHTPVMTMLIRNGAQYYVIVLSSLLFIVIGSLFPSTNHAVNGAGFLTAIWSAMCTRLILSGRSWYSEMNSTRSLGTGSSLLEMNSLPGLPGPAGWHRDGRVKVALDIKQ